MEGLRIQNIPNRSVSIYINRYIENVVLPELRKEDGCGENIKKECQSIRLAIYERFSLLSDILIKSLIEGLPEMSYYHSMSSDSEIASEIFIEEIEKKGYYAKITGKAHTRRVVITLI